MENSEAIIHRGPNYEMEMVVDWAYLDERRRRYCERNTGVEFIRDRRAGSPRNIRIEGRTQGEELKGADKS